MSVGVGVHQGPVILGYIGSDSRREYTVIGDVVNVAARLCGQAPASRVLASEPVAISVGDDEVVVEAKSELALKGRGETVSAWTLRRS